MKKKKVDQLNNQEVLNKVIEDISIIRKNRREIPKYSVLYDFIESIPMEFINRVTVELNERAGYYILYLDGIKVSYLDSVEFVSSDINDKCNKEVTLDMMNEGVIVIEFIRNTNKFRICDYDILGWKSYELKEELTPVGEGEMPF